MVFLELLAITGIVISIKAAPCGEGQHCSDCDNKTGHCLKECDLGYFDLKCRSVCSKKCKKGMCHTSTIGIGVCTEGCAPGYQGSRCLIPCDRSESECTACPGGCDGGYCQLNSCTSGCIDGYYGTDCKTCSGRCRSCNKGSGTCTECHPPYFGLNCEYSCDRCKEPCDFGCLHGCVPGFHGMFCSKNCSKNCRTNRTHVNKTSDISECNEKTGDCIYGCKDGWFGSQCSHKDGNTHVTDTIKIGLPTAASLLVLMILLAVSYHFRKSLRIERRGAQADNTVANIVGECKDSHAVEYHGYCEILEDDINRSEPPTINQRQKRDSAMPVLADCFPAARQVPGGPQNARPTRDDSVGDPGTAVNYISPVE